MIKLTFRFFIFTALIFLISIIYLSTFGIETKYFNSIIEEKSKPITKKINLKFNKTKIKLNLKDLNLSLKLVQPRFSYGDRSINLNRFDFYLPIKYFFNQNFILEKIIIKFTDQNINKINYFTSEFLSIPTRILINRTITKGAIDADSIITFDEKGKITKNLLVNGKLKNSQIYFSKHFIINDVSLNFKLEKENFELKNITGFSNDVNLSDSKIIIKKKNKNFNLKGILNNNIKVNKNIFLKTKIIKPEILNKIDNILGDINLTTKFELDIDKSFNIKNSNFIFDGETKEIKLETKIFDNFSKFIKKKGNLIIFKDLKLKAEANKKRNKINVDGKYIINEKFQKFQFLNKFDKKNLHHFFSGSFNIDDVEILLPMLNYKKNKEDNSQLTFSGILNSKNILSFDEILFKEGKSEIKIKKINFNNKFKIISFDNIYLQTEKDNIFNNSLTITQNKSLNINGKIFDARPFLKNLGKKKTKYLVNDYNKKVNLKFNEIITNKNDHIFDFILVGEIINNSFINLSSQGKFTDEEIIEIDIYKSDTDTKILKIFSDRAKPFVQDFKFIKGFEGGKLKYHSEILKDQSKSKLTIDSFKVSRVPALAQLLSLASLQGIADTLSGEGIRFDSFEMDFTSKDKIINITEAFALGPSISLLLEGYIKKNELVSLRGTLVPATTVNKIIKNIPLLGNILIGKKVGEGVFGVSFKMKGHPKDIKTTVNPIKTLTPRFIVRTVEKLKKKKQGEIK